MDELEIREAIREVGQFVEADNWKGAILKLLDIVRAQGELITELQLQEPED